VLTNLTNVMAEFSGIATSLGLFGVSRYISVPLGAVAVWFLVVKGTYRSVEKIFLFACIVYGAYIVSALMIKPNWKEALINSVHPQLMLDPPYLIMLIGMVGTSIAPWMQFYLQASIVEKGIRMDEYKFARFDVVMGSIVVHVVAFFIILVCAETLHKHGIAIETAKDAALSLAPLAGTYCTFLFAFGLVNASLFAASILPLSTTYLICEGLGWETGIDKKFVEAPEFYGFYSLMIFLGAGIILLPNMPLIAIMYVSQIINGMVLPVVLIFILLLVNDRNLMQNHTNGPLFNAVAWLTTAVMIALTVVLLVGTLQA
jgi:Mn2+/Fe2+ NRAMP family transporter